MSISHACTSPTKAPPMLQTRMRSPTTIRSPKRVVRTREIHRTSRMKDVQKDLEAEDNHLESTFVATECIRSNTEKEEKIPTGQSFDSGAAMDALPASKEDEGYTDYMEGLRRQKEVAQCLKQDLLRDNARMRLKGLHLKEEVSFYYGTLTRIELLVAQQKQESGRTSNQEEEQITKLSEQIQRVISAPKSAKEAT